MEEIAGWSACSSRHVLVWPAGRSGARSAEPGCCGDQQCRIPRQASGRRQGRSGRGEGSNPARPRDVFSGEIDGKLAENTQKALRAYADAKSLTFREDAHPRILCQADRDGAGGCHRAIHHHGKRREGTVPEKAAGKDGEYEGPSSLGYTSPREALAEKFHMSEALLSALNPGKKFDRAGETIFVANVLNKPDKLKIGRVEVDKSRQTVKAFDTQGALVAFFPATVGSDEKPTPSGTLKVVSAIPIRTTGTIPITSSRASSRSTRSPSSRDRITRLAPIGSGSRPRGTASTARQIPPR